MDKVFNFFRYEVELCNNDVIVVGCSGGPDSMMIMHVLQTIKKEKNINIICAHVNHNVREESKDEELFLKEYCRQNDIVFESMIIEQYNDENFHNQARRIRYEFFEKIISKYSAKYLVTAHHGDDLIETILMRMVRGSTLRGYAGIEKITKKDNYLLVRPLLSVTKDEIAKYNEDNNIPYVIDRSNFKDGYTRNRYRKNVLPFLKQEEPNVHEKFLGFSEMLFEYNNFVDKIVTEKINNIYNSKFVNIELFLKEEILIQKRLLFYVLEKIYGKNLSLINMKHVMSIIDLINSCKVNGKIDLPGNFVAIKQYNELIIEKTSDFTENYRYELRDLLELSSGHIIKKVSDCEKNDNNVCRLLSSELTFPLYVRNRAPGDVIELKKINGKKKIKDVFIDSKVPLLLRDSWPIVVDSKGTIVWIPGIKKSKFSKQKNEKYDIIFKYD